MNWRRIRKWSGIAGGLGLVALLVASWLVGSSLISSANRPIGPPPNDFPFSTIEIASESGSVLAGWHHEVADPVATAILLHPIRGDRRSMLSRARLFRKHGYSTLLVDLQAHGESKGSNITIGHLEKHDVTAAIEYVRAAEPDEKIVIVGRSLGGAATLLARPSVDAVVLEAVYPTVSEAVHNRIKMRIGFLHHIVAPLLLMQLKPRLGISTDQLRPIDQLVHLNCPIVVATGDQDEHTTIGEARQIYDLVNSPKQFVAFEGAEHEDLYTFDALKYEEEVVGFVNRVIGSEQTEP